MRQAEPGEDNAPRSASTARLDRSNLLTEVWWLFPPGIRRQTSVPVARKSAEGQPSRCQLNPAGECRLILVLLFALLLAACGSLGPATVATDRLAYARVTADSAKQQTLLNIVRLRYGD
jgi:hypothetical protein